MKSPFLNDPEIQQYLKLHQKLQESDLPSNGKILRGPQGEKPVAGLDFPLPKDGYTPVKGKDYFDGKDGYNPIKGEDYFDGVDGKTPTKAELESLIKPLIPEIKIPDIPAPVHTTQVVKEELKITKELVKEFVKLMRQLPEKDRLDIGSLRNAQTFLFNGIRYKVEELMRGAGGSTAKGVASTDISGQFDGVTTTFTVPKYSSILQFTITGWPPEGVLRPTVDFTTPTNTNVTINTTAPVSGTTGIILYVPF